MSTAPLISIVLPTYNGSRYLAEAVASVRAQTFQDWELIIVDDCSKDSTPELIAQLAAEDSRIRPFRNEKNLKLPGTLNAGFEKARGQLLTWTSDDNRYLPTALERMAEWLTTTPEVDLVYADLLLIDDDGKFLRRHPRDEPEALAYCNPVAACFLYRRQVHESLNGYDTSLFLVEDYDFWLRAACRFHFYHLQEDLYEFRCHSTSLSATRQQDIKRLREQLMRQHLPHLKISSSTALARGWMLLAAQCSKRGDYLQCLQDTLHAAVLSPRTALRGLLKMKRTSMATED